MKSRLLLSIFIVAAIILAYFSYPIVKNRYFKKSSVENNPLVIENSNEDETLENPPNNSIPESNVEETKAPDITITPKDCDNECKKYKKENEKEYCEQICGITTYLDETDEEEGDVSDCDEENGIKKDYCLKDIAIEKNDFKICEEIKDDGVKKTCKNRVMEDIMEDQQ